jgi:hypothetical protein
MDEAANPGVVQRGARAIALGSFALSMLIAASVEAGTPAQRFHINATVSSPSTLQSDGRLDLKAALAPARKSLAGGGFVVTASVAASPSGCSSDTIFADGFDP